MCVFFHFVEFFIWKHFDVDASRHFVLSSTPHSTCSEVFFFKKQRGFAKPSTKSRPFLQSLLNELLWDEMIEMEMEIHWPHLEAFWQKKSISWDFKKVDWHCFAVWGMLWYVCLYFGSWWHFSDLLMTYPLMSYPSLSNDTSSWKCSRFWNAVSNIPFFCIPALYCLYRGHGIYDLRVQMIWISNSSTVTEKWGHHTSKINYGL